MASRSASVAGRGFCACSVRSASAATRGSASRGTPSSRKRPGRPPRRAGGRWPRSPAPPRPALRAWARPPARGDAHLVQRHVPEPPPAGAPLAGGVHVQAQRAGDRARRQAVRGEEHDPGAHGQLLARRVRPRHPLQRRPLVLAQHDLRRPRSRHAARHLPNEDGASYPTSPHLSALLCLAVLGVVLAGASGAAQPSGHGYSVWRQHPEEEVADPRAAPPKVR